VRLRAGRHFRLTPNVRVIVSRDEGENKLLENYRRGRWSYNVVDVPGPVTIVEGEPNEEEHLKIASITARYSDAKESENVQVLCEKGEESSRILTVSPWNDDKTLDSLRV